LESVTLSSIQAARARIGEAIHVSPCHLSHHLSELTGLPLYLKLENLQRTGSFKERGALNKLLTLSEAERTHGVITASAGNHAQGVAFHASARGIRAQIVMPLATPQVKVAATRGYGAEVILHGASYDEACERLCVARSKRAAPLSIPSTIWRLFPARAPSDWSCLNRCPDSKPSLLPIGGGGLISGIACALKETNSKIRVIGVEPEKLPSMLRAREAGAPVTINAEATIADASPCAAPAT